MPPANAKINAIRNISVSQNYFKRAVRGTNVKSRTKFQQIIIDRNALTPEAIGNSAKRINIRANQTKTPQDRFIEIFA